MKAGSCLHARLTCHHQFNKFGGRIRGQESGFRIRAGWRRPRVVGSAFSRRDTGLLSFSTVARLYFTALCRSTVAFTSRVNFNSSPPAPIAASRFFDPRASVIFFVRRLKEVRQKMHCLLVGWVLMPEHFHLLFKPQPAESTSVVIKELKEETAKRILRTLRENLHHLWCCNMLARLRLPPTVHDESSF